MKKILALILSFALSLTFVACGGSVNEGEGNPDRAVAFTVIVTDLDGNETKFEYEGNAPSVGEFLQAVGLIEGEQGDYGLYINTVNGITADWDKDQTYWAFYIDGEYALTGIDLTEITEGATYGLTLTKG